LESYNSICIAKNNSQFSFDSVKHQVTLQKALLSLL